MCSSDLCCESAGVAGRTCFSVLPAACCVLRASAGVPPPTTNFAFHPKARRATAESEGNGPPRSAPPRSSAAPRDRHECSARRPPAHDHQTPTPPQQHLKEARQGLHRNPPARPPSSQRSSSCPQHHPSSSLPSPSTLLASRAPAKIIYRNWLHPRLRRGKRIFETDHRKFIQSFDIV